MSRFLVEIFNSTQYTGNILYSIMNKELIIRQLTFVGFVAGTTILYRINELIAVEFFHFVKLSIAYQHYDAMVYAPLGLTILQVWLVTKYLHK
ncbi:MAG: hypothetical protein VXX52_02820 [Candidatus Neomarinimicrobiota bacterium]|nr:hypothetical protein [Candidatus Neomarinimicrobiota bacterium]